MIFKYCPNCAGISTMVPHEGLFKCSRCNYVGKPQEGTIMDANSLSRRIKAGINPITNAQNALASKPAQGKPDASSMDTIKQSALKNQSDMKKIDLAVDDRLKQLKGKKSENFEFL